MGNENDRRKDDDKMNTLIETVTEMKLLVMQVHQAMFGHNGNPGMKAEWERYKGGLSVWKWLAGSGGAIAFALLLLEIYRALN